MGLLTKVALVGMVAGAAFAVYVQRRRTASGQSYGEILESLPTDARRAAEDLQRRAVAAVREGRAAARASDEELKRQLKSSSPDPFTWTTPEL
jgi:uncharacterized membrane protein